MFGVAAVGLGLRLGHTRTLTRAISKANGKVNSSCFAGQYVRLLVVVQTIASLESAIGSFKLREVRNGHPLFSLQSTCQGLGGFFRSAQQAASSPCSWTDTCRH